MSINYLEKIELLYEEIQKLGLITKVVRMFEYPDEPRMYRFGAYLNSTKKYSDGMDVETTASGSSFNSANIALFKCLMETIERFATMNYLKKDLIHASFEGLKDALDPTLYINAEPLKRTKFCWVAGKDLLSEKSTSIPAQTIFYNYKHNPEPQLTVPISTGSAAGFDKTSTLLRCIYEIIERDAFMTIYLSKIKVPKIDLSKIKSKEVKGLIRKFSKRNLELMVFDITNDLNIPSFLGVIIDRTGIGPSISLGLKSSINKKEAIIGCIQESLQIRIWMRNEITFANKNDFGIEEANLASIRDRGLYWLSPNMLKHVEFLINQKPKKIIKHEPYINASAQLKSIKKILSEKHLQAAYVDITPKDFKKIGCFIFKVVIPQLQPLYFKENKPEIRIKRIHEVGKFFNQYTANLNEIPHPLL